MLRQRLIVVLIVLFVVQLGLVALVYWPRPSQATSEPVFPNLSIADITALTIADSEGKQLKLARRGEGWVLPDAGDYPAQTDRVNPLLEKLVGLKTGRLVAETAASHARLQVAEDAFVRRIDLETVRGERYTLYLGTAPRAGATHFRLKGQDRVYLTAGVAAFDATVEPVGYIDATYVSIPTADIAALRVENAQGVLEFTKEGESWKLAGLNPDQALDTFLVQSLVGRFASLSMTRPLGTAPDAATLAAWGLNPPAATVTITTRPAQDEGKTHVLQIGAKDAETNNYYAKYSESPYYVQIAGFSLDDFVTKKTADFIATPTPTPVPTPAATPTPTP